MTSRSKTDIKAFFETGDRPTQSQFEDLIDSYVDRNGPIGTLESLASGAATGAVTMSLGTPSISSYASLISSMGITVYTTAQAINAVTSAPSNVWYGTQQFNSEITLAGKALAAGDGELTISSGSITPTGVFHTVDTEGDASSDNLDTLASPSNGQLTVLRAENTARTVVFTESGNIRIPTSTNISLDDTNRAVLLIYDSTLLKHIVLADGTTKEYVDAGDTIVQTVYASSTTMTSGTAQIPNDDTIPQNTEGLEAITCTITPTSATNKLRITAQVNMSSSGSNQTFIAALFQDSTANALHAATASTSISGDLGSIFLVYEMTAGTTSATTFKVRCAGEDSTTVTLNGAGGARRLGGILAHTMTIEEIKV